MGLAAQVTAGKVCGKCRALKPLDEFYFHNTARDQRKSQCKLCVDRHKRTAFQKNPWNKSAHGTNEYWAQVNARRAMLKLRYAMKRRAQGAGHQIGYTEVKPAAFLGDMLATGAHQGGIDEAHRQAPYIEMMALCEAFEAKLRK